MFTGSSFCIFFFKKLIITEWLCNFWVFCWTSSSTIFQVQQYLSYLCRYIGTTGQTWHSSDEWFRAKLPQTWGSLPQYVKAKNGVGYRPDPDSGVGIALLWSGPSYIGHTNMCLRGTDTKSSIFHETLFSVCIRKFVQLRPRTRGGGFEAPQKNDNRRTYNLVILNLSFLKLSFLSSCTHPLKTPSCCPWP